MQIDAEATPLPTHIRNVEPPEPVDRPILVTRQSTQVRRRQRRQHRCRDRMPEHVPDVIKQIVELTTCVRGSGRPIVMDQNEGACKFANLQVR